MENKEQYQQLTKEELIECIKDKDEEIEEFEGIEEINNDDLNDRMVSFEDKFERLLEMQALQLTNINRNIDLLVNILSEIASNLDNK
jgi:CRISPR/Cas system CMR subunit Cmr4 (Cas7 group RAMP superfamily)|tara:strand:- start:139 stop:399 length:261 start_codon:yes stop_codon:yes gene_type:complete